MYSEQLHFQSDSLCKTAEEKDVGKLCSILNAILAEHCNEMPQLFARLAGEYQTSKEAIDQVRSVLDKAFSESVARDDKISHVCGPLAYHLEQLNSLLRLPDTTGI